MSRERISENLPRVRKWAPWCGAAFVAGMVVLFKAVGSGLARYDDRPSVIVVQHVLLMMVAPPLVVLGRPVQRGSTVRPQYDLLSPNRWGASQSRWGDAAPRGSLAGILRVAQGLVSWLEGALRIMPSWEWTG